MAAAVLQARGCAAANGQDCQQNGSRNNLFHVLISSMICGIFFGEAAAAEIKKVASVYGSQGRALLAATEILIRLEKPPEPGPVQPKKRVTFRLHTRTVQLIQTLSENNYDDDPGQVFSACVKVLKMKK